LVTMAESLKTLRMLTNPLSILTAFGRSNSIKEVVQSVANGHLTYKYGWKQLYKDITDFGNLYESVSDHMKYLQESKGKWRPLSAQQVDEVSPGITYDLGRVNYTKTKFSFDGYKRTSVFSLHSILSAAEAAQTRSQLTMQGLGVGKIIEAAWDIVPFSFMVDWLINWKAIGNALSAGNFSTHKLRYVGHSTKYEWTMHPSVDVLGPSLWDGTPGVVSSWTGKPGVIRSVYSRTPGFPDGHENAGVFSGLSLTNLADAAAIIVQRL